MNIFRGNSSRREDQIANIRFNQVYLGYRNDQASLLCNIRDQCIYKGSSRSIRDILFRLRKNNVFRGNIPDLTNLVCHIHNKAVYRDIQRKKLICTIVGKRLYKGLSRELNDMICHTNAEFKIVELVAILYVMQLIE